MKKKILVVNNLVQKRKKQIMMQKYRALSLNILLQVITAKLLKILLILPDSCISVLANYRVNRNVVSFDLQKFRNKYEVKGIFGEIFEESYQLKTGDSREESVFLWDMAIIPTRPADNVCNVVMIFSSEVKPWHLWFSLSPYFI